MLIIVCGGLGAIDVPEVWDFSTGSSKVRVGVIDLGISAHLDFGSNLTSGYDFYSNNTITDDDISGHGTHVAGIIGAMGNNNRGVTGVNWNVSLVPLQVMDTAGKVNNSACVQAVNYATNSYATSTPITILNFSIGDYLVWPELEAAIRDYPGLFVCSAGNYGDNTYQTYHYPSFYGSSLHTTTLSNIITVGAIDENNERSIWNEEESSNYGSSTVNIYAPGSNIVSTYPTNLYIQNDSNHIAMGYCSLGGTSMATPFVTGVAALLKSVNPSLTTTELKNAILVSAESITITLPNDTTQTVKKLNAYNALKYVLSNYSSSVINLGYNTFNYSQNITGTSDYYIDNHSIKKLTCIADSTYGFTISSNSPITVNLLDSDFEFIYTNTSSNISFSHQLSTNQTYYLDVEYATSGTAGTINVSITHSHSYTYNWISLTQHRKTCNCDEIEIGFHVVSQSDTGPIKTCLLCGGRASAGLVGGIQSILKLSINGSYILPNGIIVLVDEDIEAYMNGTLIFYDLNDLPVTA